MGNVEKLRKSIPQNEFDYQALVCALGDYARPRAKITDLLAKKIIIRVKKGLYVYGDDYRNKPFSREILANLIYGPSCVSLEYALNYYGLIPERVESVTSVTPKRARNFRTPVGLFFYHNAPMAGFSIGIDRIELADGRAFLMAQPEKALADKLRHDRGMTIRTQGDCQDYLVSSLRIDQGDLHNLNADLLDRLAEGYSSHKVKVLANLIRKLKRRGVMS